MIKKDGNIIWKIIKRGKKFVQLPIELYREIRELLHNWYHVYEPSYWRKHFPTICNYFMREMTTPPEIDLE